jgi:tRNA 2-thiouridine synthesizing protein A
MGDTHELDVRGLSCPQPAFRLTEALGRLTGGTLQVRLDAGTARDNVVRIAERAGWQVTEAEEPDGSLRLTLRQ